MIALIVYGEDKLWNFSLCIQCHAAEMQPGLTEEVDSSGIASDLYLVGARFRTLDLLNGSSVVSLSPSS